MTAFGQHSMAPPFYANRAKVALRARTAREAPCLERGLLVPVQLWQHVVWHVALLQVCRVDTRYATDTVNLPLHHKGRALKG